MAASEVASNSKAFLRIIERYLGPREAHAISRQAHPAVRGPTSVESHHRVWNIRFFEQSDFFFGQFDMDRGQRIVEVLQLGGADDRRGDYQLPQQPSECHLGAGNATC